MPSGHASRMMPAIRRVVLAGAVAERTDGQLLAAFVADRDADAFAGLVRRHGPMVLGVCRRVTGNHHTAEDAFQAVFLVLARRAAAVRPREAVGNWLYGVAYRTALKARAVLARRRSREKQVDVMPEPLDTRRHTPSGSPDWSDLQPVIDEELARLPEKLRTPVVLCDLEGRPQRDVARHLGVPPATLATRLASARRTLAARLTKRGVTLSGGVLAGLLSVHGTAAAVPHTLTHGITRAVEAATTGAAASGLVSAQAVQLSEGVMRMMLIAKLKMVAVVALTAVTLTGGLGLGLVPAYAGGGDDPAAAPARQDQSAPGQQSANPIDKAALEKWRELKLNVNEPVDDPTFLRRLCLDLCGTQPTELEMLYFVRDEDDAKRSKVITWLVDDNADVRAHAAKRLGVPVERVRLARVLDAGDGKPRAIVIVVEVAEPKGLAFSPDGKRLAIELNTDRPHTFHHTLLSPAAQPQAGVNDSPWIDVGDSFLRPKGQEGQSRDLVWLFSAADDKKVRVWDTTTGKAIADFDGDGKPDAPWAEITYFVDVTDSDVEFLKRVLKDARGSAPTALEEKYFAEDKDPKKREKLLDTLLKDPAVAKKLGDEWKKKMLTAPQQTSWAKPQNFEWKYHTVTPERFNLNITPSQRWVVPNTPYKLTIDNLTPYNPNVTPNTTWQWNLVTPENKPVNQPAPPQADKFGELVDELLAAKKSDAEMLEAITLAAAGRLPTESERKLTLGLVGKAADRKAAWLEVAKALAPETPSAKK
jgi:RNA polymerase sigma factor (sigma-70 family)